MHIHYVCIIYMCVCVCVCVCVREIERERVTVRVHLLNSTFTAFIQPTQTLSPGMGNRKVQVGWENQFIVTYDVIHPSFKIYKIYLTNSDAEPREGKWERSG